MCWSFAFQWLFYRIIEECNNHNMDPAATREDNSVASVVDNTRETTGVEREASCTRSSYVPLNLMRITAGQLRALGTTLGIPASGNVSDLRLMIKGQITEGGRDSRNVQVLLPRSTDDVTISQRNYEGIFLNVTPDGEPLHRDDSEPLREPLLSDPVEDKPADELQAIRSERDALRGYHGGREGCLPRTGALSYTGSGS